MMPNVYPGWVARRFEIPYVVSPRGTLGDWPFRSGSKVKRLFWPLVQKPALAAVTGWHATSDAEYADIRRMGFREPVAVIPNGIDVPPRVPKEPRGPRTLLYLGRLHPKKGLDWLLSAWAAVERRFPEWRLRIVGPDERGHLAELTAQARALGLKRVAFDGPVYGEERWRAYAEAEIVVLPTRHENFGLVVAEALAAGTPVITTHGAPWAGLARRGCGWWIEPGVEPLVGCLEDALACSPERLAEMGQAGRAWMETEFSWPTIGVRMAAVYRWLLGRGPRPSDVRVE
jgi:glycosyltransferase involved in cell wall biosynthesis